MSLGLQWLDEALARRDAHAGRPGLLRRRPRRGRSRQRLRRAGGRPRTFASSPAVATGVSSRPTSSTASPTPRSAGPATAARTTSAWRRSRPRPSATRTSSTSATTTRSTATPAGSAAARRRRARGRPRRRRGKPEPKKDIMAIMAAHRVPYAATLSLAHRDDFLRKLRRGPDACAASASCCMLSPCPAGWKSEPADTRRAVAPGGRLRPVPALRGLRRPPLPHQRPRRTARRWRTTSRGRDASRGGARRGGCARRHRRAVGAPGGAGRGLPPTDDSVSSDHEDIAGCACWWRTGRPCWRAWPGRSRAAA